MSLRSPLGRVLGHGTAKDGTDHWIGERISAIALVLLGLWFAASLTTLDNLSHAVVVAFIGAPFNSVLLGLFCATMAYHSHMGVRVVLEDYVHEKSLKITALIASRFAHVLAAIACMYAILRIGVGA